MKAYFADDFLAFTPTLVEMLRPIKNSLRGSEVNGKKSPRSTKWS